MKTDLADSALAFTHNVSALPVLLRLLPQVLALRSQRQQGDFQGGVLYNVPPPGLRCEFCGIPPPGPGGP